MSTSERQSLYGEVTAKIIAELEEGRLPWVQPWVLSKQLHRLAQVSRLG
jgi:antirestriction protein ArdC